MTLSGLPLGVIAALYSGPIAGRTSSSALLMSNTGNARALHVGEAVVDDTTARHEAAGTISEPHGVDMYRGRPGISSTASKTGKKAG